MDGTARRPTRADSRISPRKPVATSVASRSWWRRRSPTSAWARGAIRSSGWNEERRKPEARSRKTTVAWPLPMREADDDVDLLVVGGGPCGLAAAISAKRAGMRIVVIEAHVVASTIAQYPTYVRFFSTAVKLSLGGIPFVVATEKPTRRDGLAYYRAVVEHFALAVGQYDG